MAAHAATELIANSTVNLATGYTSVVRMTVAV